MRDIDYRRPASIAEAVRLGREPGSVFIGGGTNLIDLMKSGVVEPGTLIDVTRLPLATLAYLPDGGVSIGALVRNSALAADPFIRENYPLLSQALLAGASPQLRNMATTAGNLLQRTRCYYFYDSSDPCNKRNPGSGCAAREGVNRIHAILGASEACVAVNPSDMSVALAALEAVVVVASDAGLRRIALADFHRLPGTTPQQDNNLAPGELVVSVELPAPRFRRHASYLKVRDRASFAFALISVAAALDMEGTQVRSARLALGGVAHKPWRSRPAEILLEGRELSDESIAAATTRLLEGAEPLSGNGFKLVMARNAIARSLQNAQAMA